MSEIDETHEALGLLALGDSMRSLKNLHDFAEACPAPSHRFFGKQSHKILSMAIDAAAAGTILPDDGAIFEYLSRLEWQQALDGIKGKQFSLCATSLTSGSCFAGIRAATLASEAMGARSRDGGITYGPPGRVLAMLVSVAARKKLLHSLDQTVAKLGRLAPHDDHAAGELMADLSATLAALPLRSGDQSTGQALAAAIERIKHETAERAAGRGRRCSWGVASLDRAIPLRSGAIYVLSARPGGGKTSMALQAAYATSEDLGKRSVAYLSLEMSATELALALACREAQIPRRVVSDHYETLTDLDRAELDTLARQWHSEDSLWVRDSKAGPVNVLDIATWIRAQKQRHGMLELVIIDYLGLIKGTNPRQFLTDRIGEITSTLKQIALAEGVAILLLCQITREGRKTARGEDGQLGVDPIPRVEDLYGGSSIESDADGIVFLHPLRKEGAERRIDAIIAKNRRGPPATIPLWFYGNYQHFQDVVTADVVYIDHKARAASSPSDSENVF